MKYIRLSFQSMGVKLYFLIGVLAISYFMLLLFYGETVRSHHFMTATIHFSPENIAQGETITLRQWDAVCDTFEQYEGQMEGHIYASVALVPQKGDLYSSLYYFRGGSNSFTKEQYQSCVKLIKTNKTQKQITFGTSVFQVQHWDSKYSEIPVTTVAKEKLPVQNLSFICGCMSAGTYRQLKKNLQKIFPAYRCMVEQMDQVIKLEWQKTYLFLLVVFVCIFNVALAYQYIIQKQRYHIVIYRLCGCRRHRLYFFSICEIVLLFLVSFLLAVASYYLLYPQMYHLGVVSLRQGMELLYFGAAGIICGMITILFLMLCSIGLIRKPVKELYQGEVE